MEETLQLDRLVRIYMKMRGKMQELDAELERLLFLFAPSA
jgi:hypothetical protein